MGFNDSAEEIRSILLEMERLPEDYDLRGKVLGLIPAWSKLRELGVSLIPEACGKSARDRILYYFRQYPKTIISHKEILIVSGISECARRIRELRVEFGWSIVSGPVAKEMQDAGDLPVDEGFPDCGGMGPDDYIMFDERQDREAALRWNIAKTVRNGKGGSKSRILDYLLKNVGKPVSGEELRYVAKGATEWARRVRELRTEDGWSISTYWNGRPELKSGMYLLEDEVQLPVHDRKIPDAVRREVLLRDDYTCKKCGWNRYLWNKDDPRHLELHHMEHHAKGGSNETDNLMTLCNICHDLEHRKG